MPYTNISELPEGVKTTLPKDAQTLWMRAYNFTYRKYYGWSSTQRSEYSWGAVKSRYHKSDTEGWIKNLNWNIGGSGILADEYIHFLDTEDSLSLATSIVRTSEANRRST